jgi:hypothetical protein
MQIVIREKGKQEQQQQENKKPLNKKRESINQ